MKMNFILNFPYMSLQTEKDTICYKVQKCIDETKRALATGDIDLMTLVTNLNAIRKDAQHMEDALKIRKTIMEKHGLEKAYQEAKGKKYTKTGINKMPEVETRTHDALEYRVIVEDKNGNVIYDNKSHAGVFSIVERIEDIDEQGMVDGNSQQFTFGHDLAIWYAFDQLQHGLEKNLTRILLAIRNAIQNKTFSDPAKKKRMLELMNNKV